MPPPASASSSLSLPRAPAPLLPLAGPSIQPATEAVDVEMANTTSLIISSPTVLLPVIPSPPMPIPVTWQDRQELSAAKVPPVLKAWLHRQTAAHETVSCRIYIQGPDKESIAKGLLQYIGARVQSLEEDLPLPEGVEIDGWSVEAMQTIPQFSVGLPENTSLGEEVACIVWGHVWQLLLDEGNTLGFWTQVVKHNNFVTPVLLPPNLPLARPAQIFWETVSVFTRLSLEWLLECQGILPFIVSLAVLELPTQVLTRDFISEVTPNLSAHLATWPPTPTTPLQIGISDPWSLIVACPGDVC
ncbi:hypothetical protein OF83DRAFT_1175442 [Amylostereum chailletii]|nr:hypothetical protein OF83DRAFT_1175442 [Amylostereum chailletii]